VRWGVGKEFAEAAGALLAFAILAFANQAGGAVENGTAGDDGIAGGEAGDDLNGEGT
jgi:hypothetical protein